MSDPPAAGTVAEIGEFGLVSSISALFPSRSEVRLGPGDDAAVLALGDGDVVVSLDMLLERQHFRRDWSSARDIGAKAAAANISDMNAMGGRAVALLVGFGAPPELESRWVTEFAEAFAEEAGTVGASVIGGDVTRADVVTLAVTVIGRCEDGIVRRSGARAGDVVALAGRQGWAAAGYAVLARGFRSPRAVVDAHRRPEPPYEAGPAAARLGATALIDVSDGLVQDLGHVAAASAVGIDVERQRLDLPEALQSVGAALNLDPMQFVLTGGDDYCLAGTFPADVALGDDWRVIGSVREGPAGAVTVDGEPYDDLAGHQHFQ